MISSEGENVYSTEVEDAVRANPAVRWSAEDAVWVADGPGAAVLHRAWPVPA